MIDRNILQERYRETKDIIDEVIVDTDYERHSEPYHDPSTTMLEVLRIMFAYNLAKRYKSLRSREQIASFVDPEGIREWLDWVHQTRNGGADNGYGHVINSPDSYSKSPGIKPWTHFGVHELDGLVSGPGRTALWYNRITGSFQEAPCRLDPEMIRDMTREANAAARRIASEGLKVPSAASMAADLTDTMSDRDRNSEAAIRLGFTGIGGSMLIHHSPFAFDASGFGREVMLQAHESPRLEALRRRIDGIVESAKWPEETKREILITVGPVPHGADSKMLRASIILRFDQPDKMLETRVVDQHLAAIDYDPKWSPERILEEFEGKVLYKNHTLVTEMEKDCLREAATTRRRINKARTIGEGKLRIDHVARHMLEILADHDPKKHAEVLAGKAANIQLPLGTLEGFLRGRSPREGSRHRKPKKTETISFQIAEGQIRTRFHITDDVYWDRTRLRVRTMPEAVLTALPGRPARDVLDHPLADLLGPVNRAYKVSHNREFCWISFESMLEITDREED